MPEPSKREKHPGKVRLPLANLNIMTPLTSLLAFKPPAPSYHKEDVKLWVKTEAGSWLPCALSKKSPRPPARATALAHAHRPPMPRAHGSTSFVRGRSALHLNRGYRTTLLISHGNAEDMGDSARLWQWLSESLRVNVRPRLDPPGRCSLSDSRWGPSTSTTSATAAMLRLIPRPHKCGAAARR